MLKTFRLFKMNNKQLPFSSYASLVVGIFQKYHQNPEKYTDIGVSIGTKLFALMKLKNINTKTKTILQQLNPTRLLQKNSDEVNPNYVNINTTIDALFSIKNDLWSFMFQKKADDLQQYVDEIKINL